MPKGLLCSIQSEMTDGDVKLWETTSYTEKQSTHVHSQSMALQLMTQHFDHSLRELILISLKQKLLFHFIPLHGKDSCKKIGGGGGRQSFLLIKDNIWQAEHIKKALFKARRLSSHRLFKRLEKMLAIIYFHLLSEISLSVYWEGELKAKVKRAYFFC